MKHNIDVEGLPEGWKAVSYRYPEIGEWCWEYAQVYQAVASINPCLIVEKIQPRRIVLEETEEIRKALPDEYYEHTGGLAINNSHRETSGEYKIWREVKE